MIETDRPNAHTLTLLFHRFLDEEEWRLVLMAVRSVPFVQEKVASVVMELPEKLLRRRDEP